MKKFIVLAIILMSLAVPFGTTVDSASMHESMGSMHAMSDCVGTACETESSADMCALHCFAQAIVQIDSDIAPTSLVLIVVALIGFIVLRQTSRDETFVLPLVRYSNRIHLLSVRKLE